ncbi:MAG: ATP-binding cassette domain-containing protein [Trueperaceae bacterium]|nr:ATP-binding cassette domain-containing protein [Trueperaceae bacterium]
MRMQSFGRRPAGTSTDDDTTGRFDPKQLRRLWSYTRPYSLRLWSAVIASSIAALLGVAFPVIVGDLFNTAFGVQVDAGLGGMLRGGGPAAVDGAALEGAPAAATSADLNLIAGALFAVFLVQAIFNFVRVFQLGYVGEAVVADLRKALFGHLMTLSIRFFEARRIGEITSRLTSDIGTVQAAVSQAVAQLINQSIQLVGGVVVLIVISPQLTLVMLAVLPAVIVATAIFGRRLRAISTAFQDEVAEANASAEEAIAGIRIVQSFTAEGHERARYAARIDASFGSAIRRARVRAWFIPTVVLSMSLGIGVVLWYGGQQALAGVLAPGTLITFLLLTVLVAASIGSFTGLYSQLMEAMGASKRIFELLDTGSDLAVRDDPVPWRDVRGAVRFEQVRFRYGERGDEWVLDDIDLDVRPGEVVAIVGPSGAGKSTLVTLVPRFFDPTEGRVLVDGIDVRDLSPTDLRSAIGIVPQETLLFSGTLRENVRYGRPDASDHEVVEACRAANAHPFIESFPDGYDTTVGERGVKLSGGQRQRVAIARALLKDPRILILDEATSSLDSESEALVQAALERLMVGRTTFVIAHRLSTVVGADRIVVIDDGRVVAQGTHDDLLRSDGLYRDLYRTQFRHDTPGTSAPSHG